MNNLKWNGKIPKQEHSRFQLNDFITVNFFDANPLIKCQVKKISFTENEVLYNLNVLDSIDEHKVITSITDVNEEFCDIYPSDTKYITLGDTISLKV